MKFHFNVFGRDKNYKGGIRHHSFDTLDEAVAAADALAPKRIQIVVLDEDSLPVYRTGKNNASKGLKGTFFGKYKDFNEFGKK